eukprot:gene19685-biopygen2516
MDHGLTCNLENVKTSSVAVSAWCTELCVTGKKQPTSSWVRQMWDKAEYVGSLNMDSLNGDVVSGCIADLLRVLVAPAAPHLNVYFRTGPEIQ